ncbi:MAG: L-threonylcarbamoyladenylate synthase [Myxococcales bacterium]|nr:L-threonylcarbamoyladenylate synthase [Myxococcales bacterium]
MLLEVNAEHPEPRKIAQAVEVMRRGGVIAYPTDTVYALGCDIHDRKAMERIYRMKGMDKSHLLSFVCADLSKVSEYAHVHDYAYRIMRRLLPGPYTFVLQATREVPKVLRQKRKTVGIRVPDHEVALSLVRELGSPVASTSASLGDEIFHDPRELESRLSDIELVFDVDSIGLVPSTVIDLSGDEPEVLREGAGEVDFL